MSILERIASHKIMLAMPVIGMAAIYMWQPISDYFLTGGYDANVILQIETEANKIDADNQLLVIHVKPINRGSVPVNISGDGKKGTLVVEIRKIENTTNNKWVLDENLQLVNTIDAIRNYKNGYMIEPNAYYDEVEAITLANGFYWVKATLTYDDGDFIDQSSVVKLTNE